MKSNLVDAAGQGLDPLVHHDVVLLRPCATVHTQLFAQLDAEEVNACMTLTLHDRYRRTTGNKYYALLLSTT